MRIANCVAAIVVVAGLSAGVAQAADLVRLEWGDLYFQGDGDIKPKSWSADTGASSMTLSVALDTLMANADGGKQEASANFSGYFNATQPHRVNLPSMQVDLTGHIVKTAGSSARLDVTVGGANKTFEWGENEIVSETFTRSITMALPGGQLPTPFPVTALVFVKKPDASGAVLLSLDKIDVHIGILGIASREP